MRKAKIARVGMIIVVAVLLFGLVSPTDSHIYEVFYDWHALQGAVDSSAYPVLAIARVIDGDTFEAWLLIAPRIARFTDIRLFGVDTPEMKEEQKEDAQMVRERVIDFLASAEEVTATFTGDLSFERWVCSVSVDGVDLASWLTDNGWTKQALGY